MNDVQSANNGKQPASQISVPSSDHGVHQLGYRGWSGSQVPGWTRWFVIAIVGVRRSWNNPWLKRIMYFAWIPAVWFGFGIFLFEQSALSPDWRQMLGPILHQLPPSPTFDKVRDTILAGDYSGGRHTVWCWLLNSFIRYPQAVIAVLIVGLMAPQLISQDIRSRAFLLYFSRPLTRGEYIAGKMASLWFYLGMISVLPALQLYMLGVLLSPNLNIVMATWDLPLRIISASIVLMLPTSAMALCFSSLTQESRYAGFAWFAVWILGWFTYGAVTSAETFNARHEMMRQHRFVQIQESPWTHLSLYHTLGRVQSWIFGFSSLSDVWPSIVMLSAVTVVSLAVLFYRISKPMRI